MTEPESPLEQARVACVIAGLDPSGLQPMRLHSNAVFSLPGRVVVRVGAGADAVGRAGRAVMVTRWLAGQHFPTVVPVGGISQPVVVAGGSAQGIPVTFWEMADVGPDPASVPAIGLGRLLARLHQLCPPFVLPRFRPLERLAAAVRESGWLAAPDRQWIEERTADLEACLNRTEFRLGWGLVHGDAQLNNVFLSRAGSLLGDWDNVSTAPREWDLVPAAVEQRFGGSPRLLTELLAAYGADPTLDPGWAVLCDIYELRSVAAHIRRAPVSPPHARQAALRIASLRRGDRGVRWSAVG
ncbi:aminoglycoside phosphotransferase family protein [Micromonospora sp. NPDC048839]|uniref:aminoglycoside phosphotransferase family protein n=1 Tax=Micromonospora sp. NPDC048839 TaxID=3155641 RepID=UPI0033C7656A